MRREQKQTARLPIEVVTPTSTRITLALQTQQQPRHLIDLAAQLGRCAKPRIAALSEAVQVAVTIQEQAYALGIVLLGHHQKGPQVDRRALAELDQYKAGNIPFPERGCLEERRVQAVVGVPACVIFRLAVSAQACKAFLNHAGKPPGCHYEWIQVPGSTPSSPHRYHQRQSGLSHPRATHQ